MDRRYRLIPPKLMKDLCRDFLDAYQELLEQGVDRESAFRSATERVAVSAQHVPEVVAAADGMNLQQQESFMVFSSMEQPVQLGDLASELGISRQAAYARVGVLAARGLVARDADNRGAYVLTDEGRTLAEERFPPAAPRM